MQINGVKLTPSQAAVYEVLKSYGPVADHALVPLAQHQMRVRQSSSGIRTRRKELLDAGLIVPAGRVRTGSNRYAYSYKVA